MLGNRSMFMLHTGELDSVEMSSNISPQERHPKSYAQLHLWSFFGSDKWSWYNMNTTDANTQFFPRYADGEMGFSLILSLDSIFILLVQNISMFGSSIGWVISIFSTKLSGRHVGIWWISLNHSEMVWGTFNSFTPIWVRVGTKN